MHFLFWSFYFLFHGRYSILNSGVGWFGLFIYWINKKKLNCWSAKGIGGNKAVQLYSGTATMIHVPLNCWHTSPCDLKLLMHLAVWPRTVVPLDHMTINCWRTWPCDLKLLMHLAMWPKTVVALDHMTINCWHTLPCDLKLFTHLTMWT